MHRSTSTFLPISLGSMSIWMILAFLAKVSGVEGHTVGEAGCHSQDQVGFRNGLVGREAPCMPSMPRLWGSP